MDDSASSSILDDLDEGEIGIGRGYSRKPKYRANSTKVQEWLSNVNGDEVENKKETVQTLDDLKELLISKGRGKKSPSNKSEISVSSKSSNSNEQINKKTQKPLCLFPGGMSLTSIVKKTDKQKCVDHAVTNKKYSPSNSHAPSPHQKKDPNVSSGSTDKEESVYQGYTIKKNPPSNSQASQPRQKNDLNASDSEWLNNEHIQQDPDDEIPYFSRTNPDKTHLKVGCSCELCKFWQIKDFDDDFQSSPKVPKKKIVIKPFPFFKTKEDNVVIQTKPVEKLSDVEKKAAPTVIVHGSIIPPHQRQIVNIPFIWPVHEALKEMNYIRAKPIQQYVWPAIMRNLNACIIHIPNTGKSMCYIPPICSFLLDTEGRYDNLPKLQGPICIVLCPNSTSVEIIKRKFFDILRKVRVVKKLNICIAMPPMDNSILNQFSRPCDILICTPKSLVALLLKDKFNLKRLCHFIVEDIDEVYENSGEELKNLLRTTQEMILHRKCVNQVQFICTSTKWTKDMENMLKTLYATPLVCIGNYLEAAIYGRADFQFLEVTPEAKVTTLYKILKDIYQIHKCVVFCEKEDFEEIKTVFEINGINMVQLVDEAPGYEMKQAGEQWSSRPNGNNTVLICSDLTFSSYLAITSATLLFNYSLPQSWTTFIRRFSCLIDSYKSPFDKREASFNCQIYTFINDSCVAKFPRIFSFFQRISSKLPPRFLELTKQYIEEEENSKLERKVKLCSNLKSLGACSLERCPRRHKISVNDINKNLPMTGILKFKLIHVKNVNMLIGRIYEFLDYDGKPQKFDNKFNLIQEFFEKSQCLDFADDIELNETYIYQNESQQLRCVITHFKDCDKITKKPTNVIVEYIDFGYHEEISTDKLFKIPEDIKSIPPTCHKIYISNIKPPENEMDWSCNSKSALNKILEYHECKEEDIFSTANILLQLDNSFWVEDVVFHVLLERLNEIVNKFATKKFLLEHSLARCCMDQLNKLYMMCKNANIKLPKYKNQNEMFIRRPPTVKTASPQNAFFMDDDYNEVIFCSAITPDRFYVKLKKFQKLFHNFQKTIESAIKEPFYKRLNEDELEIGKYYLAKDTEREDGVHGRVLIVGFKDDQADCFFVDFGDYQYINKKEIKFLREDLLTKLPFQVIECSLYGTESTGETWLQQATDVLYDYCLSTESAWITWHCKPISSKDGMYNFKHYSVVLYLCENEKPLMLNKLLIDCGFGKSQPDNPLDKFKPPEIKNIEDNSEDESEKEEEGNELNVGTQLLSELKNENNSDKQLSIAKQLIEECENNEDEEDEEYYNNIEIEVNDPNEFYGFFLKKRDQLPVKTEGPSKSTKALPPITALPLSETRAPQITWHQTNKQIIIIIHLCNVKNLILKLLAGKVIIFEGYQNNVQYSLKLELFSSVEKTFTYTSDGPVIKIVFTKVKEDEWPRLPLTKKIMKNIKYNLEKYDISEEDTKERKFLDLRIEDTVDEKLDGTVLEVDSNFEDSDSSDFDLND